MASKRIALLAGASGLTGGHLLDLLLSDLRYACVHALVRRAGLPPHSRLQERLFDYDKLGKLPAVDDAYCCLGTTIRKAGSRDAFRKVDCDYVINLANRAKTAGARRFLVVSSLGAHRHSAVFYSRVKGEMESALQNIGFEELHIFQPSLLLGDRHEFRFGEHMGIATASVITPFMLGPMRKYRPIEAKTVAAAMWKVAWTNHHGNHVYRSDKITELAR